MSLLRDLRTILPISEQARCRPETALEAELNEHLNDRKATRKTYSAVQLRRSR